MAGYGVIGGTGVLQGDQFTRAKQARTQQNRQEVKGLYGRAKGMDFGSGSGAVESGAAIPTAEGVAAFESGVASIAPEVAALAVL